MNYADAAIRVDLTWYTSQPSIAPTPQPTDYCLVNQVAAIVPLCSGSLANRIPHTGTERNVHNSTQHTTAHNSTQQLSQAVGRGSEAQ